MWNLLSTGHFSTPNERTPVPQKQANSGDGKKLVETKQIRRKMSQSDSRNIKNISTCEALNLASHSDWRLPNVKELRTLVDNTKSAAPVIDAAAFPSTQSSGYWSSTVYAPNTTYAWNVSFYLGYVSNFNQTFTYYVRCVR